MLHADVLFLLQDFKRGITQFDFLGGLKIENFSLFPFLKWQMNSNIQFSSIWHKAAMLKETINNSLFFKKKKKMDNAITMQHVV